MKKVLCLVFVLSVVLSLSAFATENNNERRYQQAIMLMEIKDYLTAAQVFDSLGDYKDSVEKADEARALVETEENIAERANNDNYTGIPDFSSLSIQKGDIINFGHYEQDNDTSDGKEAIEWIVLERNGNTVKLISKNGLDSKPYNYTKQAVTWETCTLRNWLNDEFYNTAFTIQEQAKIVETAIRNEFNGTIVGNVTTDKVVLLNIDDAEQYFTSDDDRSTPPTAYAVAQGADRIESTGNCWWWLWSAGYPQFSTAFVNDYGEINAFGDAVYGDGRSVRPVVVVRLS